MLANDLVSKGWGSWWLPPQYSEHGGAIDELFVWIFWITMVAFVLVEIVMIVFMVKYRHRPDKKKGIFTHGNTRLEMAWTIAPAIILFGLSLFSIKVWDNYRYSPIAKDPERKKCLVVGQQFKWNVVYPGPDGELGRYLMYPKPTDTTWPVGESGKPTTFMKVAGPAFLPYDQAVKACNAYIEQINPMGKDFSDPAGKDDDWTKQPGRAVFVPYDTGVEVQLGSKDVLHDFALPQFRVKLDAVPGMRGVIYFRPLKQSTQEYSIDSADLAGKSLWIDLNTPGVEYDKRTNDFRLPDPSDNKKSIIRNLATLNADAIAKLKAAGLTNVRAFSPFEIVCMELCGQGHATMRGEMVVVSPAEFEQFENKGKTPSTQPAVASVVEVDHVGETLASPSHTGQ